MTTKLLKLMQLQTFLKIELKYFELFKYLSEKVAKKRKRKPKKYTRKKKEKDFGDWIEQKSKEFAEEMEGIGKRFSVQLEREAKKWEKEESEWWFRTFGFMGPIIGSVFGLVFILFGVWILNFINLPLKNSFITAISSFIFTNIHWFFAIFIFFGYSTYLSKKLPKTYWIISPFIQIVGAIFIIWISIWFLNIINVYANNNVIAHISNFLYLNLWEIFLFLLILGYFIIFTKRILNIH